MIRPARRLPFGLPCSAVLAFAFLVVPGAGWAVDLTPGTWRRLDGEARFGPGISAFLREPSRELLVMQEMTNEFWKLDVDDPTEWTRVVVPGPNPGPRERQPMVYDSRRDRWILVRLATGRTSIEGPFEVWALDLSGPPAWTRIHLGVGPSFRNGAYVFYDEPRDRVLVYGGGLCAYSNPNYDYSCGPSLRTDQVRTDLWAFPLAGPGPWVQLPLAGTPPRAGAGGVLIPDLSRGRLLLAAPNNEWPDGAGASSVWSLDPGNPTAWEELAGFGCQYPLEYEYAAFVDSLSHRVLTHGGRADHSHGAYVLNTFLSRGFPSSSCYDDLAGKGAHFRWGHVAVPDPMRNRVLLVGGSRSARQDFRTRETWSVDLGPPLRMAPLGTWRDSPAATDDGETGVFDPVGERVVLWGGRKYYPCSGPYACPPYTYYRGTWSADVSNSPDEDWTLLSPSVLPDGRWRHSTVADPRRNRSITFGGANAYLSWHPENALSEVVAFDFEKSEFAIVPTTGAGPTARYAHAAVLDSKRDRMLVLHGWPGHSTTSPPPTGFTDSWSLALDGSALWAELPIDPMAPRPGPGILAVYDPVHDQVLAVEPPVGAALPALWQLALEPVPAWTRIAMAAGPGPDDLGRITWDPVRERLLYFESSSITIGGHLHQTRAWVLDPTPPARWIPLEPSSSGNVPAMSGRPIVYDSIHDRFVVPRSEIDASIWALEFGSPEWPVRLSWRWDHVVRSLSPEESPIARVLIHGGSPPDSPLHPRPLDLSRIDRSTMTWSGVVPVLDAGGAPLIEVGDVDGDGVPDWTVDVVPGESSDAGGVVRLVANDDSGATLFGQMSSTRRVPVGVRLHDDPGAGVDAPVFAVHSIHAPGQAPRIRLTTSSDAVGSAALYDVRGRRVAQRTLEPQAGTPLEFGWGTEARLAPGIYLVRVRQGENAATVRIVAL